MSRTNWTSGLLRYSTSAHLPTEAAHVPLLIGVSFEVGVVVEGALVDAWASGVEAGCRDVKRNRFAQRTCLPQKPRVLLERKGAGEHLLERVADHRRAVPAHEHARPVAQHRVEPLANLGRGDQAWLIEDRQRTAQARSRQQHHLERHVDDAEDRGPVRVQVADRGQLRPRGMNHGVDGGLARWRVGSSHASAAGVDGHQVGGPQPRLVEPTPGRDQDQVAVGDAYAEVAAQAVDAEPGERPAAQRELLARLGLGAHDAARSRPRSAARWMYDGSSNLFRSTERMFGFCSASWSTVSVYCSVRGNGSAGWAAA